MNSCDVVVIGAGISGLCCAKRLVDQGFDVRLLESGPRAGGMIQSALQDGYLLETGPTSVAVKPVFRKCVAELGLEDKFLEAPLRSNRRFIYHKGALRPFPTGLGSFLATPLLSWSSRFRILGDLFRRRRPGREMSAAEFFRQRFGQEVVDNFVSPFVSGIHAGNAETLSFQAAFPLIARFADEKGSLLRGGMAWSRRRRNEGKAEHRGPASLGTFRGGMGELAEALAKALWNRMHRTTTAESLSPLPAGGVEVRGKDQKGVGRSWRARAVVVAQSAPRAAETLAASFPVKAAVLAEFPYSPLIVAHLGLALDSMRVAPAGFGFLVPRNQGLRLLGCLWTSSVFEGRAPKGHALLTLFYGGATDTEIMKWGDAELEKQVETDLGKAMGWDGRKKLFRITRLEKALPAYNLGHLERVSRLQTDSESGGPVLVFVGNYLQGVSVPDCVEGAWSAADSLAARLRNEA